MSDEEQSADNKSFLARWSQRKHEAKQPDHDAPTANADVPSGPVAESDVAQEFDLSSLPKLEDMTATTDITGCPRTSPQRGAAKILGAGSRDPQLRQSCARLRLRLEYAGRRTGQQRDRIWHGCRASGFADHG